MPHYFLIYAKNGGQEFPSVLMDGNVRSNKENGKLMPAHSTGDPMWPEPKLCVEIPQCVAELPLDTLWRIYKGEYTPAQKLGYQPLLHNIATVKLRRIK